MKISEHVLEVITSVNLGIESGSNLIAALLVPLLFSSQLYAQCARVPPPEGLVYRCHGVEVAVPNEFPDFVEQIEGWMKTCVIRERAAGLVNGNTSLGEVWSWISHLPNSNQKIEPLYESFDWTDSSGDTCYGVESVQFSLVRRQGIVVMGDLDVTFGPTDEQVKSAARAAADAVRENWDVDSWSASRMLCILEKMEDAGSGFDDKYFAIAPSLDLVGNWNPPACFKEGRYGPNGYDYHCKDTSSALEACSGQLADRLASSVTTGISQDRLAEWLFNRESEINRGLGYLRGLQESGSAASLPCVTLRVFMDEISSRSVGDTIYSCY